MLGRALLGTATMNLNWFSDGAGAIDAIRTEIVS